MVRPDQLANRFVFLLATTIINQAIRLEGTVINLAKVINFCHQLLSGIPEQGADYVLALKGNQGNLHSDVQELFTSASEQKFKNIEHQFHEAVEKGHGRIETRRYWTMGNTEHLIGAEKWKELKTVGMVESQRTINGTTSTERRYYLVRDLQEIKSSKDILWNTKDV
jgi:hypothetical protein